MKALIIDAKPCQELSKLDPDTYIGYRLDNDKVEHIVVSKRRVHTFTKRCSECIFAELAKSTHIIHGPTITHERTIKLVVSDAIQARKIIRRYKSQVIDMRKSDIRGLALSPKQRKAISLLANGEGNISRISKALGISKPAAWKLVKKAIKKLSATH